MLSKTDACEYWRSHESEKRSFELEAVERTVKNQTTVKREELASMLILNWIQTLLTRV